MVLVFALQIDNACEDDVIIVYCSEIPSNRLVGIFYGLLRFYYGLRSTFWQSFTLIIVTW